MFFYFGHKNPGSGLDWYSALKCRIRIPPYQMNTDPKPWFVLTNMVWSIL
jgi:hypothetical protein